MKVSEQNEVIYFDKVEIVNVMTMDYKSAKYYIGSIHSNKNGTNAEIIGKSLISRDTYYIQFMDEYGIIKPVKVSHIKNKTFSNQYDKTMLGVGYLGCGQYTANINRRATPAYAAWKGVIERSYSDKWNMNNPTYSDVTTCEEWHNFQVFAEWYYNNAIDGYHLDKDLLSNGIKIYSPETCVFLPIEINSFLSNITRFNKCGYTGVYMSDAKFISENRIFGENRSIKKSFNTAEEAGEAYIKAREIEAEKVKDYMRELGHWNEYIISHIK